MTIEKTLAERGNRYGSFQDHANISQALQDVMRSEAGWGRLAPDQRQALTVIADKIARMLNGDPTYRDNWHDIVGYAKLVDDRMAADELKDKDGWIDWPGKAAQPVSPDQTVEVRLRDGGQFEDVAGMLDWWGSTDRSAAGDIVSFRRT